jgi:hypothetical protein
MNLLRGIYILHFCLGKKETKYIFIEITNKNPLFYRFDY